MKRRVPFAMIALALAAAFAAFAALLVIGGEGPARGGGERVVAIFKMSGVSNAFWESVQVGVESGAQDFGFQVSVRAPKDEINVDEQIGIVRDAIAERPAAIVLAASDYHRLVEPVREAKAAGIFVVCVDSFIETDDADAMVGTDNEEAGQKCGAALLRRLPAGSRVAVMSYVQGSSTAIGRESGLKEALGGLIEISGTTYSASEEARAYEQAKEILSSHERPEGIAALNLPTLLGAAHALSESGLKDSVVLVGVDSSPEIAKYLERGVIRDAIVQKPFNMGYLSMAVVRDLLSGKRPKKYTNTGSADIDKENMFEAGNQKLLFPVSVQ